LNNLLAAITATATATPTPPPLSTVTHGWDLANKWSIIVSLIGFPLGLIGVAFTFWEARRSAKRSQEAKTASQSAQEAVRKFRQDLTRLTTISDFSKALSIRAEEPRRQSVSSMFLLRRPPPCRTNAIGIMTFVSSLPRKRYECVYTGTPAPFAIGNRKSKIAMVVVPVVQRIEQGFPKP
jgi:hypothetical protein